MKWKKIQCSPWITRKVAPKASNVPSQDIWKFTPVSHRTSAAALLSIHFFSWSLQAGHRVPLTMCNPWMTCSTITVSSLICSKADLPWSRILVRTCRDRSKLCRGKFDPLDRWARPNMKSSWQRPFHLGCKWIKQINLNVLHLIIISTKIVSAYICKTDYR